MAQKDGRCPNCGSLLSLDPNEKQGHCLFCDAVFSNEQAFEIAANPADYTFPNLPQPKYEGPSRQPKQKSASRQVFDDEQTVAAKKKKARQAPKQAYVHKEPIKLPDIKLPPKIRKKVILFSLVAVLLTVGISTPLIISRNTMRAQLLEALPGIAPFEVNPEQSAVIRRTNNSYLLIVAAEPVSEEEMIALFKGFAEERAEVRGLDPADFRRVYRPVTVKLLTPEGGFLIAEPRDVDSLENGTAIRVVN